MVRNRKLIVTMQIRLQCVQKYALHYIIGFTLLQMNSTKYASSTFLANPYRMPKIFGFHKILFSIIIV